MLLFTHFNNNSRNSADPTTVLAQGQLSVCLESHISHIFVSSLSLCKRLRNYIVLSRSLPAVKKGRRP